MADLLCSPKQIVLILMFMKNGDGYLHIDQQFLYHFSTDPGMLEENVCRCQVNNENACSSKDMDVKTKMLSSFSVYSLVRSKREHGMSNYNSG